MAELHLDGRRIADDEPCYVIAEIGSNHGGNLSTARQMITKAAQAGVHAVKFQKRDNATLYSASLLNQPYDHEHSYGPTYGAHRQALEFGVSEYTKIAYRASVDRVTWFATAFDEPSADFLVGVGAPAFKIASGGLTDLRLLRYVGQFGKPIILSTGGGTMRDVDEAVATLAGTRSPFALLHCTAAYPASFEDLNLRCIPILKTRYPELVIGWSCHVHNISMAMAAYAYGARILETHFTLNRSSKGTDHGFSMEPATLTKLCKDLARVHVAAGDGVKRWYPAERGPIAKMRRVETDGGWQITGALHVRDSDLDAAYRDTGVGAGSLHRGDAALPGEAPAHESRNEGRVAVSPREGRSVLSALRGRTRPH